MCLKQCWVGVWKAFCSLAKLIQKLIINLFKLVRKIIKLCIRSGISITLAVLLGVPSAIITDIFITLLTIKLLPISIYRSACKLFSWEIGIGSKLIMFVQLTMIYCMFTLPSLLTWLVLLFGQFLGSYFEMVWDWSSIIPCLSFKKGVIDENKEHKFDIKKPWKESYKFYWRKYETQHWNSLDDSIQEPTEEAGLLGNVFRVLHKTRVILCWTMFVQFLFCLAYGVFSMIIVTIPFVISISVITLIRLPINLYSSFKAALTSKKIETDLRIVAVINIPFIHGFYVIFSIIASSIFGLVQPFCSGFTVIKRIHKKAEKQKSFLKPVIDARETVQNYWSAQWKFHENPGEISRKFRKNNFGKGILFFVKALFSLSFGALSGLASVLKINVFHLHSIF